MKTIKINIFAAISLCIAVLVINAHAFDKSELATVTINLQNKTNDKTLEIWIRGINPNWSGEKNTELRVHGPNGKQPLKCEIRGDCESKHLIYSVEPGQNVKSDENFLIMQTGSDTAWFAGYDLFVNGRHIGGGPVANPEDNRKDVPIEDGTDCFTLRNKYNESTRKGTFEVILESCK